MGTVHNIITSTPQIVSCNSMHTNVNTSTSPSSSQAKVSPLLLSSTSPSTTSSISPSTPPSSSSHSHGLSSSSQVSSPATSLPSTGLLPGVPFSPVDCSERFLLVDETISPDFGSINKKCHLYKDGRPKPHLTITVPSNEDLRISKVCILF